MNNEEEIIEIIKEFLELREIHSKNSLLTKSYLEVYQEAIQGLLDLYNKEKEENRKLRKCHLIYEEMTGIDLLLEEE